MTHAQLHDVECDHDHIYGNDGLDEDDDDEDALGELSLEEQLQLNEDRISRIFHMLVNRLLTHGVLTRTKTLMKMSASVTSWPSSDNASTRTTRRSPSGFGGV